MAEELCSRKPCSWWLYRTWPQAEERTSYPCLLRRPLLQIDFFCCAFPIYHCRVLLIIACKLKFDSSHQRGAFPLLSASLATDQDPEDCHRYLVSSGCNKQPAHEYPYFIFSTSQLWLSTEMTTLGGSRNRKRTGSLPDS